VSLFHSELLLKRILLVTSSLFQSCLWSINRGRSSIGGKEHSILCFGNKKELWVAFLNRYLSVSKCLWTPKIDAKTTFKGFSQCFIFQTLATQFQSKTVQDGISMRQWSWTQTIQDFAFTWTLYTNTVSMCWQWIYQTSNWIRSL
jgi:hypothetical protein